MRTALHDDLSAEALQALLVAPWDYAAAATAAATKAVRLRMLTLPASCTRLWKLASIRLATMVGHVPGRTCAWRGYRVNQ